MRGRVLVSLSAIAAAATCGVQTAGADEDGPSGPPVNILSQQVGAPFNLDVSRLGLLVADGGPGVVGIVRQDGSIKTLVANVPGASGIASVPLGLNQNLVAYTSTVTNEETFENTASSLEIVRTGGMHVHADTLAFEKANNPDASVTYGIENPTQCQSENWPAEMGPINYTGGIDSHAYSVAARKTGDPTFVVADAGGNDLLLVDLQGNVSVIAVLPRQPLLLTSAVVAGLGLPDCFVGATYYFESVPTDVEVDGAGMLWVTTLPGGPEDPSLGARGSMYKVNPTTGAVRLVATGFAGATNLAIGPHNAVYVAELFGGQISKWQNGTVTPYVSLPGVVAVEYAGGGNLFAATLGGGAPGEPPSPGSVVKVLRVQVV